MCINNKQKVPNTNDNGLPWAEYILKFLPENFYNILLHRRYNWSSKNMCKYKNVGAPNLLQAVQNKAKERISL